MIKKQKNNITAQDLNCRKNRYIKNLEGEIWKSLVDYPNYIISNMGRVFSIEKKRVLKPYVCPDKQNPKKVLYPTLKLKNRWGKFDNVFLHKVVAIAFVKNTENKPQIHHKDKNSLNQRADNLMFVTAAEHQEIHKNDKQQKGSNENDFRRTY